MTRIYIPKVGAKVKLRLWEHYSMLDEGCRDWQARFQKTADECQASVDKGLITREQAENVRNTVYKQYQDYCKTRDVPTRWAWFKVLAVGNEQVQLEHVSRAVDAPDPAWTGWVSLDWIEAPLGWKPTYEIICKDKEQADKVVEQWFVRGIHVWTSHDLGSAGGKAFTPVIKLRDRRCIDCGHTWTSEVEWGVTPNISGETSQRCPKCNSRSVCSEPWKDAEPGSPHWQYTGEPTETILADDCSKLFTVKWAEEILPPLPDPGPARKKALAALKAEGWEMTYIKGEACWVGYREHLVYKPEGVDA